MSERKTGEPGCVPEGTLRDEDLIPKFMELLEELDPEVAKGLHAHYAAEGWEYDEDGLIFRDPFEEVEESLAGGLFDDLFDALHECTPAGHYFGTNVGDPADYGFYPTEDPEVECPWCSWEEGAICGVKCPAPSLGWRCTRLAGHEGAHVACVPTVEHECATWS